MPTFNKEIADWLIRTEGYDPLAPGDPRVVKIVQYNNQFNGALAYGCIYEGQDPMGYENSPACHNPKVIWEAK